MYRIIKLPIDTNEIFITLALKLCLLEFFLWDIVWYDMRMFSVAGTLQISKKSKW